MTQQVRTRVDGLVTTRGELPDEPDAGGKMP